MHLGEISGPFSGTNDSSLLNTGLSSVKIYHSTWCNIVEDLTLQWALGLAVLQYDVNAVGSSSSEFPMMETRLGIKTNMSQNIPFGITPPRRISWQLTDRCKEVSLRSTQATVISVSSSW